MKKKFYYLNNLHNKKGVKNVKIKFEEDLDNIVSTCRNSTFSNSWSTTF